ncbi:oxygen-insensitive NAD(P)H nitroreductase [Dechloromonas sp. CZR5]|uniref:oxygen-insensitive NAD(P)H nitroreductase n=1 Tax=Dechloromonas sp. CZR5 TaxID=2608630 RepID=UPI00123D73C6|nr:oxygen-insensitive NAD(P)H nitroreductase [Dechloromonas sp. CZR5]
MNVAQIATTRRTCKAFDPTRKIPGSVLDDLKTVLRFAPSSVNSQPWHFVIAGSDAGKEALAATLDGAFAYNAGKVRGASHVVVFCARTALDEAYLNSLLDQEEADGRFATPDARAGQSKSRSFYVGLHRDQLNDADAWADRQIYIALGNLMQAAAALGVDACPMEGIDVLKLDEALGLPQKGLRAVVMCALGYGSEQDFNARLPKSRLPADTVFSEI